ncbi:MAG: FHA domain-containing protein [Chloroflexi bacterium]|nr:FHA domain-containing protein [Chloroflexota bacterium]
MKVYLEVLGGPLDGQIYTFNKSIDMGRDPTCGISITTDNYISRRHARLLVIEPEAFLEDLNSTNGTFIEGEQLKGRIVLKNGQYFRVGKTDMQVTWK